MIAKVAIDLALDRLFTYEVPEALQKKLAVGQLLSVPFGHREARGFVLETSHGGDIFQEGDYKLKPVTAIVDAVKQALALTPPELSADILDRGIIMSGGGSKLRGLDARIRKETGLSVNVIDDPLLCVCKGAARILEELDKFRPVLISSTI